LRLGAECQGSAPEIVGVDEHHVRGSQGDAGHPSHDSRPLWSHEDVGAPQGRHIRVESGHPRVPAIDRQEVRVENVRFDHFHGASYCPASTQQAGRRERASSPEAGEPRDLDGRRQPWLEVMWSATSSVTE